MSRVEINTNEWRNALTDPPKNGQFVETTLYPKNKRPLNRMRWNQDGDSTGTFWRPVQPATRSQRSLEALRKKQIGAASVHIGPLLDAWDHLSNDQKDLIRSEAPAFCEHLADLERAWMR